MRNVSAVLLLFLAVCCFPFKSEATHLIGGEIGYTSIAPNVYRATCKIYYDCRTTIPLDSIRFNLRSPGCNTGFVFSSDLLVIANQPLNSYCAAIGNSCSNAAFINLSVVTYSAIFSFSPSQLQCNDWILSVRECARSSFANIPNAERSCLYLEAYINTGANDKHDVSPMFKPLSGVFVPVNLPATISNLTDEQYFDVPSSVMYSLKPALDAYNTPLTYSPNLSYADPIPSSAGVNLNPNTGLLTFRPTVYLPSVVENNAYAVVVEATVYKKINGVMTSVGTAQRSMPVFVVNNAANLIPEIVNATANGQPVLPNSIIQVQAGSLLHIRFGTDDANTGDSVTISTPNPSIPGITYVSSGGIRPTGIITWQVPPVSSNQVMYIPVTVNDNACPVRGTVTQIYGIRVLANPTGIKNGTGLDPGFIAYPNPFTQEINFKFNLNAKAESILVYNLLGQEVDRVSLNGMSGEQNIRWENASKLSAGAYVAKLIAANKTAQTIKFTKLP